MQAFPHHYRVEARAQAEGSVVTTADDKDPIEAAPPRPFGGPGDRWSPEELLMAAVADCLILTFRAVARASGFDWTGIECRSEGTLDRAERQLKFTEIHTEARLSIPAGADPEQARKLLEKSEASCLITNSLSAQTRLSITIEVA